MGSTFGFALPRPAARRVRPAAAAGTSRAGSRTPRPAVVVIEDDQSSAELVAVHLGAAGLRPVPVPHGEEGLAAVRALRPAAVVLDIHLPGMDGWDVLSALKADPDRADTPVVVVSVLPERGRGFALGAADYLVKPVSQEDLLGAVWRAVADARRPSGEAATRHRRHRRRPGRARAGPGHPRAARAGPSRRAPGGARPLESSGRVRPSVVLVDLLMPDIDGFAVIDVLRADPEHAPRSRSSC